MVTVLTTILSSENSSSFCQFLDGCYCTNNPMKIVSCDLIKRCGLHEDFIAVTYGCLHLKLALNDLYLQVPLEFRRSRGWWRSGGGGGDGRVGGGGGDGGERGKEVTMNAMEDQESQPLLISGDNDGFHESNKLIQLPVLHFFSVLDYGHPFVNFQSFNECWFQSITEYMWHSNADETISSSFI